MYLWACMGLSLCLRVLFCSSIHAYIDASRTYLCIHHSVGVRMPGSAHTSTQYVLNNGTTQIPYSILSASEQQTRSRLKSIRWSVKKKKQVIKKKIRFKKNIVSSRGESWGGRAGRGRGERGGGRIKRRK